MNKLLRILLTIFFCSPLGGWGAFSFGDRGVSAQSFVHEISPTYVAPTDEKVVEKLDGWKNLKFGILLHWGLYSVMGRCESWELTCEDWITPDSTRTYEEFKQYYWGQISNFNPTQFNPEQWAQVAKDAGMKYMVCTSKHHDGFCIFDSKQTDFTIMHSPFGNNPRANALKYIFDAFRNEGMKIGCYFSKPDWHSQDYWWSSRATPNRMHNYDVKKFPERWKRYQKFVYNQIEELTTGYGPLDILWLDGGWCTPPKEDIKLDDIVDMARSHQPGLIVVDRACPGKHENYQTPEQTIPEHQILNPWETCMTLTYDWGWTPGVEQKAKKPSKIIATLSEVVAKGGSLLLGVGPTPQGRIEDFSVRILHEVGEWTKANGEAIYSTVPTPIYTNADRTIWFTASKDGRYIYGIVPTDKSIPSIISWIGNTPKKGSKIINLATKKSISYNIKGEETTLTLPKNCGNGLAFKIRIK